MKRITTLKQLGILPIHRILIAMPHPDDEAVFVGGFMMLLYLNNIPYKLLTLTRGEASTHRFGLTPQDNLGNIREREVKQAAAILGATDVTICTIPDGQVADQKQSVQKHLRAAYTTFTPTHVVTLEPDGVYGHPDHIALSHFVTESCPTHATVLYATVKPGFISSPSAAKMAQKTTIKPLAPEYELVLSWRATSKKIQALHAHSSQFNIGILQWNTLVKFQINLLLTREYFIYAKR